MTSQNALPFGLTHEPFGRPETRDQVFVSTATGALLNQMVEAILAGQQVVALCGESGVGKSILLDIATRMLRDQAVDVIRVTAPVQSPVVIQQLIGDVVRIDRVRTLDPDILVNAIRGTRRTTPIVLAIDDADALNLPMLQYLWLLVSLLERGTAKLQLILVGQRELDDNLWHPDLRALREAAGQTQIVQPLDEDEVPLYLDQRLREAGASLKRVMSGAAVDALLEQSGGNLAELDLLAYQAVAAGPGFARRRLSRQNVSQLAGGRARRPRRWITWALPAGAMSAVAVIGGFVLLGGDLPWGAKETSATTTPPAEIHAAIEPVPAGLPAQKAPDVEPGPSHGQSLATSFAALPPPALPRAAAAPGGTRDRSLPAGKGLVLLAKAGDSVSSLYKLVYRGVVPPPYDEVVAANPVTPRAGDLLVFPAPPNGWKN